MSDIVCKKNIRFLRFTFFLAIVILGFKLQAGKILLSKESKDTKQNVEQSSESIVTPVTDDSILSKDYYSVFCYLKQNNPNFKRKLKSKLDTPVIKNYAQMGYQIYRYRSASKEERLNPQPFQIIKNPLLCSLFGVRKIKEFTSYNFPDSYNARDDQIKFETDNLQNELVSPGDEENLNPKFLDSRNIQFFNTLSSFNGINASQALDIFTFIKANFSLINDFELPPSGDTFSGMHVLFFKVFDILQATQAKPLAIKNLNPPEQTAMKIVFLQGSAELDDRNQCRLQKSFKLKDLGADFKLLDEISDSSFNEKLVTTPEDSSTEMRHLFFGYDAGGIYSTVHANQFMWVGFNKTEMYFGFYPTEGMLLVYKIPQEHMKRFFVLLKNLLTENKFLLYDILTPEDYVSYLSEDVDGARNNTVFRYSSDGITFENKSPKDDNDESDNESVEVNFEIKETDDSDEKTKVKSKTTTFSAKFKKDKNQSAQKSTSKKQCSLFRSMCKPFCSCISSVTKCFRNQNSKSKTVEKAQDVKKVECDESDFLRVY